MIGPFTGIYAYLSNFHPVEIPYEGLRYPTVEHAFQAAKTTDRDSKLTIRALPTPGYAKRAGRRVVLRPDWEDVKLEVMRDLLWVKFTVPVLRRQLKQTWGHELIEINNWNDVYWGVGRGIGENHLGGLLMSVRDEFIAEDATA